MENIIEPPNITSVYVKLNKNNEIVEVLSDRFISDYSNWVKVDEGVGDKFDHAQSQYFDKPLMNDDGTYNYSFIDGQIVENK